MRMIFSIVGFALFIVGCQSLVPIKERVIELPTRSYQKPVDSPVQIERGSESGVGARLAQAIRTACRNDGRFSIVHDHKRENYICYPEGK